MVTDSNEMPGTNGDDMKADYAPMSSDAVEVTRAVDGVPFQTEDIQKLATTLFIQRSRR
jgi:hypothetical protein